MKQVNSRKPGQPGTGAGVGVRVQGSAGGAMILFCLLLMGFLPGLTQAADLGGTGFNASGPVATQASFSGGVAIGDAAPEDNDVSVAQTEQVTIGATIAVAPADVGQTADILIAAYYTPPGGPSVWFVRHSNGGWSEQQGDYPSYLDDIVLPAVQDVDIHTGSLAGLPGTLSGFVGYRLADGTIIHNSTPIQINVADNTAPDLVAISGQTVIEGQALNFAVTATDPDAGDVLTYTLSGAPAEASLDPATGSFQWTPRYDDIGIHNLKIIASDGAAVDMETVTVTVQVDPVRGAMPLAGGTIDPLSIPKYVTPLVIPPVMNDIGQADNYDIAMRQFQQQILPGGIWNTLNGRLDNFPATTVWSYGPTADPLPDSTAVGGGIGIAPAANSQFNYPAYTFETLADTPVRVRWVNDLVNGNGDYLPHLFAVDQNLHWANPLRECLDGSVRTDCMGSSSEPYTGPVPMVTHVHGAHVDGHSDGYPEAWWLPAAMNLPAGIATSGALFDDATGDNPGNLGYADYVYRNDQPATTLWYHDHTLGMTRLNVLAGPAGFWLVRGDYTGDNFVPDAIDDQATPGFNDGVLPGPAPMAGDEVLELNVPGNPVRNGIREIPLVIQGRAFNQDGSVFYPDRRAFFEGIDPAGLMIDFAGDPDNPTDIAPFWNPEAFFNVMVVNGVSWPELDVAQATYRFRLLNGCNSRFLNLAAFKVDPATGEVMPDKELPFYQIGAEQGALPNVVKISTGFATTLPGNGTLPADAPAHDPGQAVLLGPAERADMLVDFNGAYVDGTPVTDGDVIRIINTAGDEPFGGIDPLAVSDAATTGQVMQFSVTSALNSASPTDPGGVTPATAPEDIVLNAEPLPDGVVVETRQLSLNEEHSLSVCIDEDSPEGTIVQIDPTIVPPYDPTGQIIPGDTAEAFEERCEEADGEPFAPKAALLGTVDLNGPGPVGIGLQWTDTSGVSFPASVTLADGSVLQINVTENPMAGDTEMWELYNFTEDAHPIHLHLVRFEVVERRQIGAPVGAGDSILSASRQPWETGYKDTVIAYPGEITVVKALFDIPGLYVWHCHILEHEDNEMMRPYVVSPAEL